MLIRGNIIMYNSTLNDLEKYIKKQKDFLEISLRFEELLSRLLAIYKNDFIYRSNKLNSIPNLSIEDRNRRDSLLSRLKERIKSLSSKLDYFIEFNKRKTIEVNALLNEYGNCFEIN